MGDEDFIDHDCYEEADHDNRYEDMFKRLFSLFKIFGAKEIRILAHLNSYRINGEGQLNVRTSNCHYLRLSSGISC